MDHPDKGDGWLCVEETTRPDWIDRMGHVNIRFYLQLAARAIYELMDSILYEGKKPDPPPTFFTLETHIRYRRELLTGQRVRVYVRPLSRTDKVLTCLIRIYRIEPDPVLSAECEWSGAYADRAGRRLESLPEAAIDVFDKKLEELSGQPYEPRVYPPGAAIPPPPEGREIVSLEGKIEGDWIDRMGHMGIEYYARIFAHANGGYMRGLGLGNWRERRTKWGAFGLESRTRYLAEMVEGDAFRVTTLAIRHGRKTLTYRHDLFKTEPGPLLCATCDHTMAFADLTKRRTVPPPQIFLDALAKHHAAEIEWAE